MAGTQKYGHSSSQITVQYLKQSVTALVSDVELLRTAFFTVCGKLDADAGVTDTNYSTIASSAAVNASSKMTGFQIL